MQNMDSKSLDSIFYASSVRMGLLGAFDCKVKADKTAEATLAAAITAEGATTQQLYYAVFSQVTLGIKGEKSQNFI